WLLEQKSLSRRLQRVCSGQFEVRLTDQKWDLPMQEEAGVLGLPLDEQALVRQVYLLCNERRWVYARTIIPAGTMKGTRRRFASLGSQPLGDLLFGDRNTSRGAVEIAKISPQEKLFSLATGDASGSGDAIWGRRSVFTVQDKPLLVVEVFLPELTGYHETPRAIDRPTI
ncbi:MAG: chorismate lyase, partial [Gammaproteobacteria bacterium]|nr:chorismate lyase [Gammaproteobacteria bacterium]